MSVCAVVDSTNTVINIIVAEPTDICPFPDAQLVLVPENTYVDMGFTWDGTQFTNGTSN